jgi:zinc resistance-associated protein
MRGNLKGIMIATIIGIFGLASLSFAGWNNGCGYGKGDGGCGMGRYHRGGDSCGTMGCFGNLSDEEVAKLDQQRSEFFKATEETRAQLYQKKLALRSELAKKNPDTGKASGLQQEISKLRGELDQKRLDFEIQARKSSPNYDRAYRGHGRMMGSGYGGRGCCRR